MSRAVLLAAALAAGCGGPRAPALDPFESVYASASEGLRVQAPPGWTMTARAELPPGPAPGEPILARWFRADPAAVFRVTRADLPADADLAAFLADKAGGAEAWAARPPAEPDSVGGAAGVRLAFAGSRDGRPYRREITAVRRGGRVYTFVCVTPADDEDARRQLRSTLDGVKWSP